MSRLVEILWYDLMQFYKHVQTCQNSMIRFDTILKTCPDLLKYYDKIWYNSTNMSRLVEILWYKKHVQTRQNDLRAVKKLLRGEKSYLNNLALNTYLMPWSVVFCEISITCIIWFSVQFCTSCTIERGRILANLCFFWFAKFKIHVSTKFLGTVPIFR